jgi:glycosyltransferase involved in cell wall biosynthesis
MSPVELTIAIPTRNEAMTLPALIEETRAVMGPLGIPYEILVVDGRSTDRTREEAEARGCRVVLQPRRGLGDAIRHAFREAKGRHVVTMDADGSHPPALLRGLVARRESADLILASRYVAGGRSKDIPLRRTLSLILNRIFAAALGLPYKDISTGYRIYRKPFIDSLSFKTLHYDIQEETVFRVHRAGGRILEIPLQFRPRAGGDSKASIVKQGIHFARTLLRLWNERVRGNVRIQHGSKSSRFG